VKLATLAAGALLAGSVGSFVYASTVDASGPPSLTDARSAPASVIYVRAHSARWFYPCATSDVQVYHWNGAPWSNQRWNADGLRIVWRHVSFDGSTVRNHSSVPIIFAGWCG
jgi:Tol biopolymer transport system component